MTIRILLFTMLPILCIAQVSPKEDILSNNNPSIERGNLTTKRNAMYNLEEIKVRWKKAALENCSGVPCVVAPSFTCGTSTVSDFDGNAYNTVAIGAQCWTKENLKVTKYNDGTLIGDSTNSTWGTAVIGALTNNNTSSGYKETFGYLYNWYAATDSRKLCPTGWHVPTDAEWTIMIQALDPTQRVVTSTDVSTFSGYQSSTAGTVMKSTATNLTSGVGYGWNPGIVGTDLSGFSALPGGVRSNTDGNFRLIRDYALFLSATQYDGSGAWGRQVEKNHEGVFRTIRDKLEGLSVRCLRD